MTDDAELQQIRRAIDAVDLALLKLCQTRARLVQTAWERKDLLGLVHLDAPREQAIIAALLAQNQNSGLDDAVVQKVFAALIGHPLETKR